MSKLLEKAPLTIKFRMPAVLDDPIKLRFDMHQAASGVAVFWNATLLTISPDLASAMHFATTFEHGFNIGRRGGICKGDISDDDICDGMVSAHHIDLGLSSEEYANLPDDSEISYWSWLKDQFGKL